MKKSFFLFILLLSVILCGCASKRKAPRERSETFIADIDSFWFNEKIHLYTRMTISSPKISDFSLGLIPRTNNIKVQTKIGLDYIQLYFSYAERVKLKEAVEKYLYDYNNNLLKDEKPTKKNAYYKSSIPVSWGMLGYSHDIKPTFYANVEYLETNKPYFRLKFEAVSDPEDGSTSPSFSIYISPAQWKQIFELCDQQALEARCDEILAQAEEF